MQLSESITRRSASNLALAFCLLPRPKREAMSALYAFCREIDDVADEDRVPVGDRRRGLEAWREDVRQACQGQTPTMPVVRELQPFIQRHGLPFHLFNELLLGVEMDLDTTRYADWEALDRYCYRVASVVGLLSIEIFGYRDARCREYAVALGQALQLTNILRDVGNDAERGRIYLPESELRRREVQPEEILAGRFSDRYARLAADVAARARDYFHTARATLPAVDRRSMATAELMGGVYWRLLQKIERQNFDVFRKEPTRLGRWQKIGLVAASWSRFWLGAFRPSYG